MAKSKARFLADVLQDDGSSIFVGNFAVPADFVIDPAGSPTGLGNASLENSSITINSYDTALGSSVTLVTDDINEGGSPTNLYFTNARAQAAFTGGTGVTITSGEVAIGQSVGTTDNVTFNQVTATVPYDNSVSGLTATNVQSAITELNTLLGGGNVGSQATYNVYEYTTAGNDTQFDLSALSPAGSYIPGYVQVYLNGLLLSESDYTAVDGSTINFSPAITNAGQLLYIVAYDSFNTAEILRVTSIDASASTNSITLDANDDLSITGSLSFADNEKATFGADSDLQIYHDGSGSYLYDTGTGPLRLQGSGVRIVGTGGENLLIANESAEVTLLFNNAAKLATTSTGIDVTGTIQASGLTLGTEGNQIILRTSSPTVSGIIETGDTVSTNALSIKNDNAVVIISDTNDSASTGGVDATLIGRGSTLAKTALFDVNGDISFYEDTGASAKFFWDASAERLGVGTTTPSTKLHISEPSGGAIIEIQRANTNVTGTVGAIQFNADDDHAVAAIVALGDGDDEGADLYFKTTSAASDNSYVTSTENRMLISSTGEVSLYGRTDISYGSPVFVINDTDATNATDQIGYISFQRQGVERSWIGYGTSTDDNFTIRNTEGPVTVNSAFEVTGQVTLGDTTTTAADLRLYDTGNNQLQFSGIGSNDFLIDLLGTSAIGTLKFNDFYVSIDANSGTDALTLISSSTGTAGPQLDFIFEKATPVANDVVGRINFNGRNSAAEGITYARIDGVSSGVLDGSETGVLSFSTRRSTTQFEEVLKIDNTGQMIFPDGIEIYQGTPGITNAIAIGTAEVQAQYPYQRIDSFSTDGSGYFWAFGAHDNSPDSTSIKMLINDSQTVDEVTVIGALKVRDFAGNEYNAVYPTFSTTGVTLNSDGDIEATGDIKLPAGFHISRKGSLSSVSSITQRYVFTHNSNSVWGSCIIEYAVTGTQATSSTSNYRKGIITFTKYSGDATPMRNDTDTPIVAGSGISVTITDNSANQFTIDFSISGASDSRYIASTLDVTASEIVITDIAHSVF